MGMDRTQTTKKNGGASAKQLLRKIPVFLLSYFSLHNAKRIIGD
jgi:hypothetical protein